MSDDGDKHWDKNFRITSGKGDTEGEAVHEIVDERAEEVEVSSRIFSLEIFPACFSILTFISFSFALSNFKFVWEVLGDWGFIFWFIGFIFVIFFFEQDTLGLDLFNTNAIFLFWLYLFVFVVNFSRIRTFVMRMISLAMPVAMCDSTWLKKSFDYQEKGYWSDENSCHNSWVCFFRLKSLWKNVHQNITNQSSKC